MSLQIRPANLATDLRALIQLMQRHLSPGFDEAKLLWLCRENPSGAARVSVATETTGEIVGTAAAYPRKLRIGSEERLGLVLGDFCIEERYRSLGPSLRLQRACLAALEEPGVEFVYDFPSRSMMAIYQRLGMKQSGELVRWARPLRTTAKLRRVIGSEAAAKALSAAIDPFLARRRRVSGHSRYDLQHHQGLCGEEFSELDSRSSRLPGIRTVRDAAYLNWRYLSPSAGRYEILTARRAGKLAGFVVTTQDVQDASIVDLNCADEPDVVAILLDEAVERFRSLGAETVSLNAGTAHPWSGLFQSAGFRQREASPIVTAVASRGSFSAEKFNQNWFVMRGERDS